MDFDQYRIWIKQFLKEGKVISPGVIQYSEEIIKLNSQTLIQLIRRHVENKGYRNLAALAELLRGEGFFNFDYTGELGSILEMMLLQAIAVFDNGEVFSCMILYFIKSDSRNTHPFASNCISNCSKEFWTPIL